MHVRNRSFQFIGLVVVLVAILGLMVSVPSKREENELARQQYSQLVARAAKAPVVNPHMRSVHIYRKGDLGWLWKGSGTLLLDDVGKPWRVVTAGHIFSKENDKGQYGYTFVPPTDGNVRPFSTGEPRFVTNPDGKTVEEDIAILSPGASKEIGGFSSYSGGSWGKEGTLKPLAPKHQVVSVATSEPAEVIGEGWIEEKQGFFVLGYESVPGESGTGFVGKDGEFYVLNSGIPVTPEIRERLPEAAKFKLISFASALKVEFPH